MALVRMNGALENQHNISDSKKEKMKNVVVMNVDTNDTSFQFSGDEVDIMDSGAMDHSSDSDYEPPGAILIKPSDRMTTGWFWLNINSH